MNKFMRLVTPVVIASFSFAMSGSAAVQAQAAPVTLKM